MPRPHEHLNMHSLVMTKKTFELSETNQVYLQLWDMKLDADFQGDLGSLYYF